MGSKGKQTLARQTAGKSMNNDKILEKTVIPTRYNPTHETKHKS